MTIYPVKGIRLSSVAAGIRYADRDDLVVIECQPGTVAGKQADDVHDVLDVLAVELH